MKKSILALFIVLCIISITGCATVSKESEPQATTSAKETEAVGKNGTRVVKDLKGEIEIPANPKRIADISGVSEELLLLNHKPVATANTDSYNHEKPSAYLGDKLEGSTIVGFYMSDVINIEALMTSNPDLIMMNKRQEKIYDQLRKIAPVVVLKNDVERWRDRFAEVGEILGQKQDVDKWLKEYDAKAAKIGEQVTNKFKGETFSVFLAHKKGFYLLGSEGAGSVIHDDFKLPKPQNSPDAAEKTMVLQTLENLTTLNPDHILLLSPEGFDETYQSSNVWKGLKAVEKGKVHLLAANPFYNQAYMPIGKLLLLDELSRQLMK
ncbi:putative siderophore-binding lipoprotein YfiY precursor [compost metagenome]